MTAENSLPAVSIRIFFTSDTLDEEGIPSIYRSYQISGRAALPNEAPSGYGVAKVAPLSDDAPALVPDEVQAPGGTDGAIQAAIEQLKMLNPGLECKGG
ncbi:hypothetical protein LG204_00640 [Methylovorus menthalis]|uniref:hypothetical protein n=1 Tax=Methylovorus menthalis TaxID=1002227 RepID=UPI001E4BDDD2|nr:hypothetical protein [Methylovorus menthalis]MCB4809821.1 hypothetical protein [Methylovorus menthalis]